MSAPALLYAPPGPTRPPVRSVIAYRCETTAHDLTGACEVILSTYRATSPRLAARWLRSQAGHLAQLLSPRPAAPSFRDAPLFTVGPDCPRPDLDLFAWAENDKGFEQALRILAAGAPYTLAVSDYDARYAICAYPLYVRRGLQFPASAGCSSPSPAEVGRHRRRAAQHAAR
ncbi:hypothetical protein [Streptomyces sp. ISL-100]|uniref:hypothetical protein n=1 Tax=Streptomyces sp. ISL-100 TaxID=2819173 RepID=UPI001BE6AAF6|nr:hypothetical protein [Streptomyces sp. ISL-100]MBT2397226.1 hypothetical protein [Streptomyces sp. ISL-100]